MRPFVPALSFFFFVFWLLAVPMEGPLLTLHGAAGSSRWFLLSHVLALIAIGRRLSPGRLPSLSRWGAAATTLLTLFLPRADALAPLLMVLIGITAAPMAVKTGVALRSVRRTAFTAAVCLVVANLMLAILQGTIALPLWPVVLAALPLLTVPGIPSPAEDDENGPPLNRGYLVFVFIFQIVSGLMYAFLFPAYAEQAFLHGLELPFYMAAVLAAVVVYRYDRDLLLAGGLTLAIAAFALLQAGGYLAINLAMFAMQSAAGCIDMFLLALLLQSRRSVSAFGYGLAVLCGGIAAGQFFSLALGPASTPVGMAGSLMLNVAALALFLRHHRQHRLSVQAAPVESTHLPQPAPPIIPAEIACMLSDREADVLTMILAGKNYRMAARELAISESSIKTYVKRICDKLGVSNRQALLQRIISGS